MTKIGLAVAAAAVIGLAGALPAEAQTRPAQAQAQMQQKAPAAKSTRASRKAEQDAKEREVTKRLNEAQLRR